VGWLISFAICIVIRTIIVLFFSLQEDDKKKPEKPEHSRKLFVGGLSYQTKNELLKTF
jgi:hypothetical protein